MKTALHRSAFSAIVALLTLASASALQAEEMVPLTLQLPRPVFSGTPVPINLPNLEAPRRTGKRPDFLVPKGVANLALKKTVTSSDMEPMLGDLSLVTDGDKGGDDGNVVELANGKQWVQIDLGQSAPLYAIVVWHFHSQARAYKAMAIQVSDDPTFAKDVQTVFNNDIANLLGLGRGKDLTYIETHEGKIVDAKGRKARYVRLYSNGSTSSEMNHYVEVEVYGHPQ